MRRSADTLKDEEGLPIIAYYLAESFRENPTVRAYGEAMLNQSIAVEMERREVGVYYSDEVYSTFERENPVHPQDLPSLLNKLVGDDQRRRHLKGLRKAGLRMGENPAAFVSKEMRNNVKVG